MSVENDPVVLLSHVTQSLAIAHNAWQGSSFCKIFAAKHLPELSDEERAMRLQLLRMVGQLIDTEFEAAMDKLAGAWIKYRTVVKK